MTWVDFLFAIALAMFVAGLLNGDDREGRTAMVVATALVIVLLLVFGSDVTGLLKGA